MRREPNPLLARIIIAGKWDGDISEAKKLLKDVYKKWPKEEKVKFLITCGGFIQFEWPKYITRRDIVDNKYPDDKVVKTLVAEAENCAKFVLSDELGEKLKEVTDYLTVGIDSYKEKISTTQNYIKTTSC